MKIWSICSLSD